MVQLFLIAMNGQKIEKSRLADNVVLIQRTSVSKDQPGVRADNAVLIQRTSMSSKGQPGLRADTLVLL